MKVMLTIAPWDLWQDEDDTLYPLGLAYLCSLLEKHGHEVEVLNLTNCVWNDVKGYVAERIEKVKPDIFGISIMSNSRGSALKMMNEVRRLSPKSVIVAGGVHTTMLPQQMLENYPIDYCVLGEGDTTFLEIVNAVETKKPKSYYKNVAGIALLHRGKYIKTQPRERIRDLDAIPFPKHELFQTTIDKYGIGYVITSRGCPYNCYYCPSAAHWSQKITFRSAQNVVGEIKYLIEKFPKLKQIHFLDDEFICNKKRVIEFCELMIKEGLHKKIEWNCLGRASSVNEEIIPIMKKSGCFQLIFGVESGSQKILDNVGKRVKVPEMYKAFAICRKYGIHTKALTMVGNPGETFGTVWETIKFARRVRRRAEPAILISYPGTRIDIMAKEAGLYDDEYWLGDGLPPLYTVENSKLKLLMWSFMAGFITNLYADDGDIKFFLKNKFGRKMSPHTIFRVVRRYLTDKAI